MQIQFIMVILAVTTFTQVCLANNEVCTQVSNQRYVSVVNSKLIVPGERPINIGSGSNGRFGGVEAQHETKVEVVDCKAKVSVLQMTLPEVDYDISLKVSQNGNIAVLRRGQELTIYQSVYGQKAVKIASFGQKVHTFFRGQNGKADIDHIEWSPDGQELVFARGSISSDQAEYVIYNVLKDEERILISFYRSPGSHYFRKAIWSEDGKSISVPTYDSSGGKLLILNSKTGTLIREEEIQ